VAVFDHYQTDDPSYQGKLMMVVWAFSPSRHEVFGWLHNQLTRFDHAFVAWFLKEHGLLGLKAVMEGREERG